MALLGHPGLPVALDHHPEAGHQDQERQGPAAKFLGSGGYLDSMAMLVAFLLALLTGESAPVQVGVGERVWVGTVVDGALVVEVTEAAGTPSSSWCPSPWRWPPSSSSSS